MHLIIDCFLDLQEASLTKLRVAHTCGYKHTYFEVNLTAQTFSKITIAVSSLGSLTSLSMWFDTITVASKQFPPVKHTLLVYFRFYSLMTRVLFRVSLHELIS